jgi:glycosyltransferase involved in cell wall biosynthesis
MRVLMISKACVVGAYRRKLEEIAGFPDVELAVVVPPAWREAGHTIRAGHEHTAGYELIVEPAMFIGYHHLHFYPGLAHHVRRLRPDVLHIDEEPYSLVTFLALRLGQSIGARCLFFSWQNLCRRYPPPVSWTEHYVLRHADFAICGNQAAVEVWRRKGYAGPVAVIPQFGVNLDREGIRESGNQGIRGFTAGYAGRLVWEKGVHLLLQATAGLEGDWRLRLLGAGPLRSCLEAQAARLGITDRVRFEPAIPAEQVPAWMHQLDVLVLPSISRPNWKEQFGRVLVEAMACGVPVVGSTCGEIPNVVGDAGLLFPEGDVAGLRDCLARLQADAELGARLAEAGRARVAERFTQQRIAAETVAVYRQTMAGG